MKFSEVILSARYRLNDVRKSDASLITSSSEDGIRWTSNQLVSICKCAGQELLRTLTAIKSPNVSEAYLNQLKYCTIQTSGVIEDLSGGAFTRILSLTTTSLVVYRKISAEDFDSLKWKVHAGEDVSDAVYTYFYNATTHEIEVHTLPLPPKELTAQAIVRIYDEFFEIKASVDDEITLPFIEVEDLYLDLIEREARRREHNFQMVKELTEVINFKYGTLGIETERK